MKMSDQNKYSYGVDPAWVNLGLVIADQDGKVVHTEVLNPSLVGFSQILDKFPFEKYPPSVVVIERYVSYGGVKSTHTEHVTMMIGALVDRTRDSKQFFFRAIDWKTKLVKERHLLNGFENPSTKLDKKFSKAMAENIYGRKFKTDHEADAACLAFLGVRAL